MYSQRGWVFENPLAAALKKNVTAGDLQRMKKTAGIIPRQFPPSGVVVSNAVEVHASSVVQAELLHPETVFQSVEPPPARADTDALATQLAQGRDKKTGRKRRTMVRLPDGSLRSFEKLAREHPGTPLADLGVVVIRNSRSRESKKIARELARKHSKPR